MKVGLFPGQGLDPAAVAEALNGDDPVLDRAKNVLGYDVRRKVEQVAKRSGSTLPTSLAQPAIFVAGIISFRRALKSGQSFDCLIGHSLGEYTALIAGGAISFRKGLELVSTRGAAMQKAASGTEGGMTAVMNLTLESVEDICEKTNVTLANDNSPTQQVLSGSREELAQAAAMARGLGGRSVLLQVDGAYHSEAMAPAAAEIEEALEKTEVRMPRIPVLSNVTAAEYRAPGEIRRLLTRQLTERVRFRESIAQLDHEATEFVDLGPGHVVGRLAKATIAAERSAA